MLFKMGEKIKFTEEELKKIKELQTSYSHKTVNFGQISVQKILLKQEMDKLTENESKLQLEYIELQKREKGLVLELNTKYGQGTLDLDSGIFIANKEALKT